MVLTAADRLRRAGRAARELRHRAAVRNCRRRWRWYLHLGSYATVLAFLVVEYAFRRWYLRHIQHVSLPVFVARLVRRWPALARSVMHDPHGRKRAHDATTNRRNRAHPVRRIRRCPAIFPGNPIVPGVVLLDRIAAALERAGAGGSRGSAR